MPDVTNRQLLIGFLCSTTVAIVLSLLIMFAGVSFAWMFVAAYLGPVIFIAVVLTLERLHTTPSGSKEEPHKHRARSV